MKYSKLRKLFLIAFILVASCGRNLLSDLSANQNSSSAIYENIIKKLDAQDYTGVVTYIQAQTASFQAEERAIQYLGQAYLGLCGFNFLDFSSAYGNATPTQLIPKFMASFTSVTMDTASCDLAHSTLANLTAASADKNMLLLLAGIAKISAYLKTNLDLDNDGTVDQNYCTTGGAAPLSDTETKKAVTALGLILQNFSGVVGDLLGADAAAAISTFLTTCEGVLGPGNCTVTDVANVTDPMALSFRVMLDSASDGFGSCVMAEDTLNDGDGSPFCCPPVAEVTP